MFRWLVLGLLACLVAVVAVPLGSAGQEATPSATSATSEITREPLTSEAASRLQGMAGPLHIERIRIPGGGEWQVGAGDAALAVVVVETGAVGGVSPAPVTIQRTGDSDHPTWAEPIAAATEFGLNAGDALVSQAPSGMVFRNPGADPVTLISIGIGASASEGGVASVEPANQGSGLVMALALVVPPPCPPGTEPGNPSLASTPGAGGGGGGSGGVAVAFAAAPSCIDAGATPVP
ncbi:MAG: hypothetical protein U0031_22790 [Thermomicrobiales bacterium]